MRHVLGLSAPSLQSLCKTKWLLKLGWGWCYMKIAKSLITTYLLCAWKLWQNNALLLLFWCLFNALTLWVCAFDTSNLSGHALFCYNSLAEVNTQLLTINIGKSGPIAIEMEMGTSAMGCTRECAHLIFNLHHICVFPQVTSYGCILTVEGNEQTVGATRDGDAITCGENTVSIKMSW